MCTDGIPQNQFLGENNVFFSQFGNLLSNTQKLTGVGVYVCNPSIWKVEAGESGA